MPIWSKIISYAENMYNNRGVARGGSWMARAPLKFGISVREGQIMLLNLLPAFGFKTLSTPLKFFQTTSWPFIFFFLMCNKQVESLIQLFIYVLSFGLFLHQIKHNVVNSEVQFLHSFLTIFSPRKKRLELHQGW